MYRFAAITRHDHQEGVIAAFHLIGKKLSIGRPIRVEDFSDRAERGGRVLLRIDDHELRLCKMLQQLRVGQPAVAQLQRANERAMHHQIRIAADRRGEMRIAREIEAEMADILRRINRLRLGA